MSPAQHAAARGQRGASSSAEGSGVVCFENSSRGEEYEAELGLCPERAGRFEWALTLPAAILVDSEQVYHADCSGSATAELTADSGEDKIVRLPSLR